MSRGSITALWCAACAVNTVPVALIAPAHRNEFDAKFPLQSLYTEAPPIDFRFNMARNFSSVDEVPGPNNRLDQQVPFNATLGLDYRMRGGMIVAQSFAGKITPKRELEGKGKREK